MPQIICIVSTASQQYNPFASIPALFKLRLSSLVIFSAIWGYLFHHVPSGWEWLNLLYLLVGGVLVTGASNGINQVIEVETDKKMDRTKERPIPAGRISKRDAAIICSITAILGLGILYFAFGWLTALLSFGALFSYAFIYTPLKPITPFAVFVGAFPGAIPPLLGWVAAAQSFGLEGGLLFIIQFIWQFPHFWAIAWVLEEDYSLGGFKLLPSAGGRDQSSAFQIYMYSLFLVPCGLLPFAFGLSGWIGGLVAVLAALPIAYYSFKLYSDLTVSMAKKVMFSSFFYLPVALIAIVLDKIF